jgi:hypothetical protein
MRAATASTSPRDRPQEQPLQGGVAGCREGGRPGDEGGHPGRDEAPERTGDQPAVGDTGGPRNRRRPGVGCPAGITSGRPANPLLRSLHKSPREGTRGARKNARPAGPRQSGDGQGLAGRGTRARQGRSHERSALPDRIAGKRCQRCSRASQARKGA